MHPYKSSPPYTNWRSAVAEVPSANVDPVIRAPFTLGQAEKFATAGSCFAQHISRHLKASGFNYLVTENAHPLASDVAAQAFNYGVFTARYGNVYTSRQLLQLFDRAHGSFTPKDDFWLAEDGTYLDPFRPRIQPGGFKTLEEYRRDRGQHFAAVRRAFSECSLFIFTLGLTECWVSKEDGAVYPICPGVAGGTFDSEKHQFINLTMSDVVQDLNEFVSRLESINSGVRVLLTVSPVPLMATAEDRHVLVSTTYSKSVLRVAAEELLKSKRNVFYFPSYEVITGQHARGAYFSDDLRSVTKDGVDHAMRLFLQHYAGLSLPSTKALPLLEVASAQSAATTIGRALGVVCEEEMLDAGRAGSV